MNIRCEWCGEDPLYQKYHDAEWGVPVHDDRTLFEFLLLEGAQAGLSWLTILRKRENYRKAYHQFDVERIAGYTDRDRTRLLADAGIVRNRLKVDASIRNAWKRMSDLPVRTDISDALSKDLKQRGCNFVGSTICYAFMQAVGMVNDHTVDCFRYEKMANHG